MKSECIREDQINLKSVAQFLLTWIYLFIYLLVERFLWCSLSLAFKTLYNFLLFFSFTFWHSVTTFPHRLLVTLPPSSKLPLNTKKSPQFACWSALQTAIDYTNQMKYGVRFTSKWKTFEKFVCNAAWINSSCAYFQE